MPNVEIKTPSNLSKKIAQFEAEKELERKNRRMKEIKKAIKNLDLSEKDIDKFKKARKESWNKRKQDLL